MTCAGATHLAAVWPRMLQQMSKSRMRGLLLEGPGRIVMADLDMPEPGPDEVLVKVVGCGVCNATDLKVYKGINRFWNKGTYPCTMGHEVAGRVAGYGKDVRGFREGDRVFMRITRTGFAEYCKWRQDHVHRLPEGVDFAEGTLGQLMPIGIRALERSMKEGDRVLIAGAGPAGMLCLMIAKALGARQAIVTEVSPFRIRMAHDLGADAVIDPAREDIGARMAELGGPVDACIECGGIRETFSQCEQFIRPGGTIGVFGTHLDPITLDMVFWESNSLSMVMGREQPEETARLMERAAQLMTHSSLRLKPLVTHRFPLSEIETVFDLLGRREEGVMKIVVSPDWEGK